MHGPLCRNKSMSQRCERGWRRRFPPAWVTFLRRGPFRASVREKTPQVPASAAWSERGPPARTEVEKGEVKSQAGRLPSLSKANAWALRNQYPHLAQRPAPCLQGAPAGPWLSASPNPSLFIAGSRDARWQAVGSRGRTRSRATFQWLGSLPRFWATP